MNFNKKYTLTETNPRLLVKVSSQEFAFRVKFNNYLGKGAGHFVACHNANADVLKKIVGNGIIIGNLMELPPAYRPSSDKVVLVEHFWSKGNFVAPSSESRVLRNDVWYNVTVLSSYFSASGNWEVVYSIYEMPTTFGKDIPILVSRGHHIYATPEVTPTGRLYLAQALQGNDNWSIDIEITHDGVLPLV